MSIEYYGYALLGVEIDPTTIYNTIYIRNCSCSVEILEGYKYCPLCGIPFSEQKVPVSEFDDEEKLFHGFKVVSTTDKKRYFLGYGTRCDTKYDQAQRMPVENILEIRDRLIELFAYLQKPWEQSKFGLWAISRSIGD